MTATARFEGSIPRVYDEELGPFLFEWTARQLGERVRVPPGGRVLELACGTGISTEGLRRALPSDVTIEATDLSEGMLQRARHQRGNLPGVRYAAADAQHLPFEAESFDAVVCQFGLMFFPDKVGAIREVVRVLRRGGQVLFGVWGSLVQNPPIQVVHETLRAFFPEDPPRFLETPFGLHEEGSLRAIFAAAGARGIEVEPCHATVELPTARMAAHGLLGGTPGRHELEGREGATFEALVEAAESALALRFGAAPFRAPLRMLFVHARR